MSILRRNRPIRLALCVLSSLLMQSAGLSADDLPHLDAQIERALEKSTTLSIPETSIADLAAFLRVQAGVPVVVDQRACEDLGLNIDDTTVSGGPFEGMTLASILNHLLRPVDLAWTIRDQALTITTPEEEETARVTRVYDVQDLVALESPRFGLWSDYDSLIDILTSVVAPNSWDTVGGPGSIEAFRGTLVASQTVHVHHRIRDCLTALRRAKSVAAQGTITARNVSIGTQNTATRRVHDALDRQVRWQFKEQPLNEVVVQIQRHAKIPAFIDLRALEDLGLDGDAPVTSAVRNRTLRNALTQMLRDVDLTFSVLDEAIVITTPEEAELQMELRAYPVADLLGEKRTVDEFTDITREADADGLIDLITSLIAPDSWDCVGGPASIAGHPSIDVLVISQTSQIHGQIEQMLMQVRERLRPGSPTDKTKKSAGGKNDPFGQTAEDVADDDPFGGGNTAQEVADPFAAQPPKDEDLRFVVYFIAVPQSAATGQPAGATGPGTPGGSGQPGSTSPPPVVGQFGGGMGGFGGGMIYGLPASVPIESNELLEIVQELVAPQSWKSNPRVYARATAGRLLIRQTLAVHDQIHNLLTRLGVLNYSTLQASQSPWACFGTGMGGGMGGMGGGTGMDTGGGGFFSVPSKMKN